MGHANSTLLLDTSLRPPFFGLWCLDFYVVVRYALLYDDRSDLVGAMIDDRALSRWRPSDKDDALFHSADSSA